VTVITADLRGLGESSVRPRRGIDFGYARLVDDAARIASAARAGRPGPLVVLGHSLGGHVGALLAGARPGSIDGLMLVACGTPYWRCFPLHAGLGILALAHAARALGTMLGYYPGHRLGFAGVEAAQLMREWGRLARRGRFEVNGLDAEATLADARLPVLVASLAGDRLAPPEAVDHLAGKVAGASIDRVHVTREMVDPRALDHFRWARVADGIAGLLADWLRRL
jgi:predicted alpha/beta hydrolase